MLTILSVPSPDKEQRHCTNANETSVVTSVDDVMVKCNEGESAMLVQLEHSLACRRCSTFWVHSLTRDGSDGRCSGSQTQHEPNRWQTWLLAPMLNWFGSCMDTTTKSTEGPNCDACRPPNDQCSKTSYAFCCAQRF